MQERIFIQRYLIKEKIIISFIPVSICALFPYQKSTPCSTYTLLIKIKLQSLKRTNLKNNFIQKKIIPQNKGGPVLASSDKRSNETG